MQQKNNYQLVSQKGTLGVFNGEVGTIQNIYTLNNSTAIDVKFDTDIYTYKDENIEELELAYSITIHKAQGSEFPCVLMPFSEALSNTDRNILYTSITRAKKMFTAVGSKKFFNYAIQHDLSVSRYSRLEKKIINSITTQ